MEQRYKQVLEASAFLLSRGQMVYSPIVHNHEVAKHSSLPRTWDFWRPFDLRMLRACDVMYVLTLPGYRQSVGLSEEVHFSLKLGKPVFEMHYDTGRGKYWVQTMGVYLDVNDPERSVWPQF